MEGDIWIGLFWEMASMLEILSKEAFVLLLVLLEKSEMDLSSFQLQIEQIGQI